MKSNLDYFLEICKIPHGSGKEAGIADYLVAFATEQGLRYRRDALNNVVIFKEASPGCEEAPAVLLQGHTDMVEAKREGSTHNFDTDPIRTIFDGDILRADGTTLGGDDGVAVATMLSLLEDEDLVHPALECVFTVQEETGLFGAAALDCSDLRATRMINLDAGPEGTFLVSCAGGLRVRLRRDLATEPAQGQVYRISLRGLLGGHSGSDIAKERANALRTLGIVLDTLRAAGVRLCSLTGGEKDNVIPSFAHAVVAMPADPAPLLSDILATLRSTYAIADAGLTLSCEPAQSEHMLGQPDSDAIISLLNLLPCGVRSLSCAMPGMVESSANIGTASVDGKGALLTLSLRSSDTGRKERLYREIELLAGLYGFESARDGDYPGWGYEPNSPLRDRCTTLYQRLYGERAVVEGIHAGLECGLFKGKMPALDIVAMGPITGAIHTPDEWLNVPSFLRMQQFLTSLLEELAQDR